jgi:D-alanine-D-alanine ligase
MELKKAIIYYNQLSENPLADELDVLEQAAMVEKALQQLGYSVQKLPFSFDLSKAINEIKTIKPDFIFNLVESIENNGEFCYFAPAIFNFLKIPYSGVRLEAMFNTTNKILAKELFRAKGISTADWYSTDQLEKIDSGTKYILKPAWEEGSLGIDEHSVFLGNDNSYIEKLKTLQKGRFFIEKLIDGREYNISVLGGHKGPEVLPLAEMLFIDFPEGKPQIMGYTSKWNEESFEYKHTRRTYEYDEKDVPLRKKLEALALKCWNEFEMCGYIRVDVRLDKNDIPYVLEINTNPCLSESGGFYAACMKKGYTFKDVMQRVVEDAFK